MVKKEVLKGCTRNERKAQYQLYRECYVRFMAICRRYQSDHISAESVFNKAFLKILNNLCKYSPENTLEAWCRKIVINTNIDEYRRNKRLNGFIHFSADLRDNGYSTPFDLDDENLIFNEEALLNFINHLPPITQQVFNLFAIDSYSHFEISEMLGISVGTSKWHMSSARKKLKRMMAEYLNKSKNLSYGR